MRLHKQQLLSHMLDSSSPSLVQQLRQCSSCCTKGGSVTVTVAVSWSVEKAAQYFGISERRSKQQNQVEDSVGNAKHE